MTFSVWTGVSRTNKSTVVDFEEGTCGMRANLTIVLAMTGIVLTGSRPSALADVIYWTDGLAEKIARANLDGTAAQDVVTGIVPGDGIALDVENGKVYWLTLSPGAIQRSNLDGTDIENLVTGLDTPGALALDLTAEKMYWTVVGTGKIQRGNLDGSGVEDLVTVMGSSTPWALAIDTVNGKMYWGDYGPPWMIRRADLDGTNVETVTTDAISPCAIALDVPGGKMYWIECEVQPEDRIKR